MGLEIHPADSLDLSPTGQREALPTGTFPEGPKPPWSPIWTHGPQRLRLHQGFRAPVAPLVVLVLVPVVVVAVVIAVIAAILVAGNLDVGPSRHGNPLFRRVCGAKQ